MRRRAWLLAAMALAACSKVDGGTGSATSGAAGVRQNSFTVPHVLRFSDGEDIAGLNPHLVQQTSLGQLSSLTMAWLVKFNHENQPIPELATEVPTKENGGISADGKTITYHLRTDAKWSDGVPFSADDVVFSTKVVLNPANLEVSRTGWSLIAKIDEPDNHTVVYHLKKPYAPAIVSFFGSAGANPCILPKHLLGSLPDINHAAYNALPVGIGPFKYKQWKRGDFVELVANPLYFRGRPKLDKVIYKIVPDWNTVVTELQSGELDLAAYVPNSLFARVQALRGFITVHEPSLYFSHVDLNLTRPALKDPAVRRALLYATDRRTIVEKIEHALGVVQDSPISPINPVHDPSIPVTPFDLDKAKAILDAAGWKLGADGIREKGGLKLALDLATVAGNAERDQWAAIMQNGWQKIGVKLTVKHYLPSLMFASYSDGGILYTGKFDLAQFQWGGDPIGDLSNLYECSQIPPNGQNVSRYCNKAADAAMERVKADYDLGDRRRDDAIVQQLLAKDIPTIVLFIPEDVFVYNSD
ncbi:MAG: peptide ABC transporter substrate-binding protein, partial [Vulcanimicrobiaceae bacterium]